MSNEVERFKCAVGCACLISLGAANADAFVDSAVSEDSSAPKIRLGGVTAYPGLAIVEKRDSNILLLDSNKQSSYITVLSPSVVLRTKKGADSYSLTYNADVGRYAQSSPDNYVEQIFSGAANLAFSTRASLSLSPEYKIGHDPRGTTYGARTLVPNTWHNSGFAGTFTYGTVESIGRIVLDASYHDLQYQNNRLVTSVYDRALNDVGGTFYYRMRPKVSTFVQMTDTRIAYKTITPTSDLSGSEQHYLVGATWDATAQTSGTFKIGQMQKKFGNSVVHPTFSGGSWEGSVRWSPREFARVDWITGRKTSETTLPNSNFELVSNNALDFGYDLSELASLHVNADKLAEDFNGAGRTDNTNSYGLKAEYKLHSWLVGDVEYTNAVRTSTDPTAGYHRKLLAVGIRSKL